MGNTISVADLERLKACKTQVEGFRRAFPDAEAGVEVTVDNVLKAMTAGLDLHWLARATFLTPTHVEFLHVVGAAWKAYFAVQRPAWDEYERLLTTIPKASRWAIGVGRVEYSRVEKAAGEKYHLAEATAWVEAYEASVEVAGKGDE